MTFILLSEDFDLVDRCLEQFFGYDSTSCAHPCQTFKTKTKFLSGMNWQGTELGMAVKMKFSPKVTSYKKKILPYFFVYHFYKMRFLEASSSSGEVDQHNVCPSLSRQFTF